MTVLFPTAALPCNNVPLSVGRLKAIGAAKSGSVCVRMSGALDQTNEIDVSALLADIAQTRNVDAFEALFRLYGPRVRAYIARQCRDGQLAEELMQETMMTVWRKASLFDPARGNAEAWIFTIARNLRISAFRKVNRPSFDPSDPAFVPSAEPAPDAALEQSNDAERLHEAMKNLPPEQAELLRYSFFDEIPHRALADQLGLPLGTIKSRIRMAFAKLRTALEDGK